MRVRIFDVGADGALVYRDEDYLSTCFPERDDYLDAFDALIGGGSHRVGGGAAPEILLIRADDDADDREERILRREIARRVVTEVERISRRRDLIDIHLCMELGAVHEGDCPLRLRDLAAADIADAVHDVLGIHRHLDHRFGTGRLDTVAFLPRFAAV